MADRFGEWIVGLSILGFVLFAILMSPLGSWQMYLVLIYLFLTPLLGGLLYIRAKRNWQQ